jgi:hypothetical protein
MKGTRKNPAVKKYAEMLASSKDEAATLEALKADKNAYDEDEISEIWEAVMSQEAPAKEVAKPIKTEKPTGYKLYDKWQVQCDAIEVSDESPIAKYRLLFIKPLRKNRPIAPSSAEFLNTQTQNNSVRYVEAGTVTNGDEITIEVSRGRKKGANN